MSVCVVGLYVEDDRNIPARDDSAWCASTEVLVDAIVLFGGGTMRGAFTTTLPPSVDPASVGNGLECMRLEDVLCSLIATLLLTLHSIIPSIAVDCNAPSVVTFVGRGWSPTSMSFPIHNHKSCYYLVNRICFLRF